MIEFTILWSIDWSWFLTVDWINLLLGHEGVTIADEIIFGRYVVSVTGVTAGLRYGEVKLDALVNPGNAHGIHIGIRTLSSAGPIRQGLAISTSGRIWSLSAALDTPDHTDGPTFVANDVVMFAVKNADGKCWLGKVGSGWYAGGDPATDSGPTVTLTPGLFHLASGLEVDGSPPLGGSKFSLRTQSSQFTGVIPSGFSPWYP